MKIYADIIVFSDTHIKRDSYLEFGDKLVESIKAENAIIYPALINSHDHLIGNWYPPAIFRNKFTNTSDWVEAMKQHPSYLERNKFWQNDGSFNQLGELEYINCELSVYKNIFSGVTAVADHAPLQKREFYESFPIKVIERYRQCHSLSLGNWWGGLSAEDEFKLTNSEMPFYVHVSEGTDIVAKRDFNELENRGLLSHNTLVIHGISLTEKDFIRMQEVQSTLCWCPQSNNNLIGKTVDIEMAMRLGLNVVLATDSSFSGGINLLSELKFAHKKFPKIEPIELFKMVTSNAQKALFLSNNYGNLEFSREELLIVDKLVDSPFTNLLQIEPHNIQLLSHHGDAIYGDMKYFDAFNLDRSDYSFFENSGRRKFVKGDYRKSLQIIRERLGYNKILPYLPD